MQPKDSLPRGNALILPVDKKLSKRGRPTDSKAKQEKFTYLYATRGDWPAKRCALEAGYAESSAANTATSLLKKPHVQARIKEIQEQEKMYTIRKPKRQREKLYTQYYDLAYVRKFEELMAGLGYQEREFVNRRQDPSLSRKWRTQGNKDYNVIHKQCVKFALAYCDQAFGPVNRKKPRYDKFTGKWQFRSVRGCAYDGGK